MVVEVPADRSPGTLPLPAAQQEGGCRLAIKNTRNAPRVEAASEQALPGALQQIGPAFASTAYQFLQLAARRAFFLQHGCHLGYRVTPRLWRIRERSAEVEPIQRALETQLGYVRAREQRQVREVVAHAASLACRACRTQGEGRRETLGPSRRPATRLWSVLHGACGDATDEVALEHEEHEERDRHAG